jgi:hypothetical protein
LATPAGILYVNGCFTPETDMWKICYITVVFVRSQILTTSLYCQFYFQSDKFGILGHFSPRLHNWFFQLNVI